MNFRWVRVTGYKVGDCVQPTWFTPEFCICPKTHRLECSDRMETETVETQWVSPTRCQRFHGMSQAVRDGNDPWTEALYLLVRTSERSIAIYRVHQIDLSSKSVDSVQMRPCNRIRKPSQTLLSRQKRNWRHCLSVLTSHGLTCQITVLNIILSLFMFVWSMAVDI